MSLSVFPQKIFGRGLVNRDKNYGLYSTTRETPRSTVKGPATRLTLTVAHIRNTYPIHKGCSSILSTLDPGKKGLGFEGFGGFGGRGKRTKTPCFCS